MSRQDKFGIGDSLSIFFDIPEDEAHLVRISGLVDEEEEMPDFVGLNGVEYLVSQSDDGWYIKSSEYDTPITVKNSSYFATESEAVQALEDFQLFLLNRYTMAGTEGEL